MIPIINQYDSHQGNLKILFPNEHGAWGMFFTAFLLGWWSAPQLSWHPLLILPAALGGFLIRYPIGIYFKKRRAARALKISLRRERKWFLIYLLATSLVTLPLFYPLGWWWLIPVALLAMLSLALHWVAILRRKERTFFVEWTAMLGLSLLAPAASYAANLDWSWGSFFVWALLILFYTQRIAAIRQRVRRRKVEPVDLRALGKKELCYSLVFLLGLSGTARLIWFLLGVH